MSTNKQANRLINEKSPYLLQHAHNPVNWFPWGDEAFQKAKSEDKPIFLSIGYSTCHWCHVMERESFEDYTVAASLNEKFVCIKVDREERPDVDSVYMSVCQALTGSGGWPLTVFLTPDKAPFYAGTYFPKYTLMDLCEKVADSWRLNREKILESGKAISDAVDTQHETAEHLPGAGTIGSAVESFEGSFDMKYGGFGTSPKFPSPHNIMFLLRYHKYRGDAGALDMAERTLEAMFRGGMYDHIGGGFFRYSTDRKWLVPHFEKMLYDNSLLAIAYCEAYQATRKEIYANIARDILDYLLRDMLTEDSGFCSAEDADSEGVEGKFYLFTPAEIAEAVGDSGAADFCSIYDITLKGNFDGKSIPNLITSGVKDAFGTETVVLKEKLLEYRSRRVRPFRDDKVLTGWNGMAIAAFAIAGRALESDIYTTAARNCAEFISNKMIDGSGRLLSRFRKNEAGIPAYAEDHAYLTWGMLELHRTTGIAEYLKKALDLSEKLLELFWDEASGGLYLYGNDAETLITRPKESYDGAIPSANSVAALNFIRLARLTGRYEFEDRARAILMHFSDPLTHMPSAHAFMLISLMYIHADSLEVIIADAGDDSKILRELDSGFYPFMQLTVLKPGAERAEAEELVPELKGYATVKGKTAAYCCRGKSCHPPVSDPVELKNLLAE